MAVVIAESKACQKDVLGQRLIADEENELVLEMKCAEAFT